MKLKSIFKYGLFYLAIIISYSGLSQGCSDAGFCTVGTIKPDVKATETQNVKHQVKTGVSFGVAQYGVSVLTPYLEYSRRFGDKTQASVKLLAGLHSGELATTVGMSDVLFQVNHRIWNQITALVGVKIPFNYSTLTEKGKDLPMAYQTSLGTYDIIFGANFKVKAFGFSVGYQQPLIQNKNEFVAEDYSPDRPESKYLSTNGYERKGDALLRFSYSIPIKNNKFTLITSALPIYHLGNDRFLNKTGELTDRLGSAGLTLNLNAFLMYRMAENQLVELTVGAPVVSRKVRPDGLSQFAVGIEYGISF
ncbi:MAG: hypothetical protein COW63_10065 [Bacteroidetes bacterium CG18_big_fil_WC_8_21_14_2_50_41_14]|nr:MAG: hypothetical protein COW63_10065 [Bacteroidetes bacterium CG18_big_fil_WC_8_21_14_2_50_41_14]PJB55055.1 MAG: hypothetical protein CO098_18355 [Bacteroidetes bacterium CG_4_9_14_3_um_filter_41_19]